MDIYRKYYRVTTGPLFDAFKAAQELNAEAHKKYVKLLDEIGATGKYYHHGRKLVGMLFDGVPDRNLFKKVRNGWMPKRNSKAAKEISDKFRAIKTQDPQNALELVGLTSHPSIFGDGRCYMPSLTIIPDEAPTAYISVPWYDEDPAKIEQYKKDKAAKTHFSSNLDAILWEPSPEMMPVKKWEVDRHIDEWNEANKREEG